MAAQKPVQHLATAICKTSITVFNFYSFAIVGQRGPPIICWWSDQLILRCWCLTFLGLCGSKVPFISLLSLTEKGPCKLLLVSILARFGCLCFAYNYRTSSTYRVPPKKSGISKFNRLCYCSDTVELQWQIFNGPLKLSSLQLFWV